MKLTLLNLFLMTIISLLLHKYVMPYERGFHCDDLSISQPFHPIIIPMNYLLFFAFIVPVIAIITTEYNQKSDLITTVRTIKQFYFGLILSFILVLVCKTYFGRLRPNSIDGICKARHHCTPGTGYVKQFTCNNSVTKLVKESRMSFYSGHSSVGTYSAVYVILYLLFRSQSKNRLIYAAQLIVFIIGLIPGYTQGINYWHHWSDIGTGYSVGAITAYLVIKYV